MGVAGVVVGGDVWVGRQRVLQMNFTGTLNETLSGGSLITTIYFMNVDVFDQILRMYDLLVLPTGPGPLTILYDVYVTGDAPPGNYTIWLHFFDQSNTQIQCLHLDFFIDRSTNR